MEPLFSWLSSSWWVGFHSGEAGISWLWQITVIQRSFRSLAQKFRHWLSLGSLRQERSWMSSKFQSLGFGCFPGRIILRCLQFSSGTTARLFDNDCIVDCSIKTGAGLRLYTGRSKCCSLDHCWSSLQWHDWVLVLPVLPPWCQRTRDWIYHQRHYLYFLLILSVSLHQLFVWLHHVYGWHYCHFCGVHRTSWTSGMVIGVRNQ